MSVREKIEALERDLDTVRNRAPDRHVESVRQMLLDRSRVGLAKYGTTTERTDLSRLQWLRHAQEEALDLAVYLETLIAGEQAAKRPDHWVCCCGHTDITIAIGQECKEAK